jgi:tetratricopeptide (TPR) repeat protein
MAALDERAYAESADHYSRSLAIFRTHLPPEHPYVAHGLASLGMVYRAQGRHAEAETLLRQSLDLTYRAGRSDHPDLARTLAALGIALMAQGRLDEAEPMFQQAEAIYRKAFGPESPYFTSVVRWHDELRRRRAG